MYVAKALHVASSYRNERTTEKVTIDGQNHGSVLGGTLLAFDGRPPLRAVHQVLWQPGPPVVEPWQQPVSIHAVGPVLHTCM